MIHRYDAVLFSDYGEFQACRHVGVDAIVLSAEGFSVLRENELAVLRSLTSGEVQVALAQQRRCCRSGGSNRLRCRRN